MSKIVKEDLRKISYQEFDVILGRLTDQIKSYITAHNMSFELIVPILRSGAFTGMHLASQLQIKNILPVQYKYKYLPVEVIEKKFEFPKLLYPIPENSNILIVDSNTVFGGIANMVIGDVKKQFPKARLFFASTNIDQSIIHLDSINQIFYGLKSNVKRDLSKSEAVSRGVPNEVIIFPWEDLEEEWSEISLF